MVRVRIQNDHQEHNFNAPIQNMEGDTSTIKRIKLIKRNKTEPTHLTSTLYFGDYKKTSKAYGSLSSYIFFCFFCCECFHL